MELLRFRVGRVIGQPLFLGSSSGRFLGSRWVYLNYGWIIRCRYPPANPLRFF